MRTLKSLCILALSAITVLVTSVPVDAGSGWISTEVIGKCAKGTSTAGANGTLMNSTVEGTFDVSCTSGRTEKTTITTPDVPTSFSAVVMVNSQTFSATGSVPSTNSYCAPTAPTACLTLTFKRR